MAFQTNTFQNNAFQTCAGSKQPPKGGKERVLIKLRRKEEEEKEILLEYARREELDEQIRQMGFTKAEEDQILEMLAALLLANEA